MGILFQIAARNLFQGGRRTLLLAMTLCVAAFFLVLVAALFSGAINRLIDAGTAFYSGDITITGSYRKEMNAAVKAGIYDSQAVREVLEKNVTNIDQISGRILKLGSLSSDRSTQIVIFFGVDFNQDSRLLALLKPVKPEEKQNTHVPEPEIPAGFSRQDGVMIFANTAKFLGVGPGDRVTLWADTFAGYRNSVDLVVDGVFQEMGTLTDGGVLLPMTKARELLGADGTYFNSLMVFTKNRENIYETLAQWNQVLSSTILPIKSNNVSPAEWAKEKWVGQSISLATWRESLNMLIWRETAASVISNFLLGILAFVIGIGMLNAMLVTVKQRTKEIGTLRAMGLSRFRVLLLFVLEGGLLGLFSSIVGAVAGALMAALLNFVQIRVNLAAFQAVYFSDVLRFAASTHLVLQVAGVLALVSAAACIWPAIRAARLLPAQALRN